MDAIHDITYNDSLERLLVEEAEKSLGLSWLHKECEAHFSKCNNWLAIPSIVLSTLAGSASVGSQTMFDDAKLSSISIGAISLLVGVLSTINSYFSWAKRTESHRLATIQYAKLHRFIEVEMSLPRKERILAKDLLKVVREQVERLAETSPPIPNHIIQRFNRQLASKYPNVAIPDVANGLKKVVVINEQKSMNPLVELKPATETLPIVVELVTCDSCPWNGYVALVIQLPRIETWGEVLHFVLVESL